MPAAQRSGRLQAIRKSARGMEYRKIALSDHHRRRDDIDRLCEWRKVRKNG